MITLVSGDEIKTGWNEHQTGIVLAFKENKKQKHWRGIIVKCPKAAREFAKALEEFAERERGE